jgi:hypothetical protein
MGCPKRLNFAVPGYSVYWRFYLNNSEVIYN